MQENQEVFIVHTMDPDAILGMGDPVIISWELIGLEYGDQYPFNPAAERGEKPLNFWGPFMSLNAARTELEEIAEEHFGPGTKFSDFMQSVSIVDFSQDD